MRVILDTNVFVSGVFFSGPPYRILEAWRDGKLQLVASPEILEEYQRVGETKILIGIASDRYAGWMGQIYSEGRYKKCLKCAKVPRMP